MHTTMQRSGWLHMLMIHENVMVMAWWGQRVTYTSSKLKRDDFLVTGDGGRRHDLYQYLPAESMAQSQKRYYVLGLKPNSNQRDILYKTTPFPSQNQNRKSSSLLNNLNLFLECFATFLNSYFNQKSMKKTQYSFIWICYWRVCSHWLLFVL